MGIDKEFLERQLASADPVDRKSSVRLATTTALPAYARVGNVITASANGALPAVDGIVPVAGNSLLLTDDGTASNVDNGIYVVTQVGSGGTPFILTRRGDANADDLVNSGMRTAVEEGTQYRPGTEFVLVTPNPIVLNTTALDIVEVENGSNGSPSTLNTVERIPEGRTMLFADDLDVEDGELDVEGNVEDIEHFENHSVVFIPRRTERVVQQNEVMFFTELTVDGTLTVDGDIEDISVAPPVPPVAPDPPGELGLLQISNDGAYPYQTEAGKLYRVFTFGASYLLPAAPADADTLGFYVVPNFVEYALELDAGANTIAYGNLSGQVVNVPVEDGALVLVSWNAVLGQWDVYGSGTVVPRSLGGIVQTTDATPTTTASYPTNSNNRVIAMTITVIAIDSANGFVGHWIAEVTAFRDGGGVVTVLEDTLVKFYKDNLAWNIQFNVAGQSINVDVVGDMANTVEWRVTGRVREHG